MNLTFHTDFRLCKDLLLFAVLLLGSFSIQAQKDWSKKPPLANLPTIQDNNLGLEHADSILLYKLFDRLKFHVKKTAYLNLDSVRYLALLAIPIATDLHQTKTLLRIYETFGWAFLLMDDQDSARYYIDKALNLASQECNYFRLSVDNLWIGWTYASESNLDTAIYYYKMSKDYGAELKDTFLISAASASLTDAYIAKGDWVSVTEESFNQFNIAKINNDTGALITIYSTLGKIYGILGLFEKQLEMAYITLDLSKDSISLQNNPKFSFSTMMLQVNSLASETYLNKEIYDSVIYYARLNLRFYRQQGMMPDSWRLIAAAYLNTNQIDSSLYYYTQLINEARYLNIELPPEIYLGMGECEFKLGHFQNAFNYYSKAETKINQSSFVERRNIYKKLYEYYYFIKDFKKAIVYSNQYTNLEDSIQNSQNTYYLGLATMKFDAANMESQIQILTKDKALQIALATKQRQQNNMVYGGMIFLLLIGGFGFNRFRKYKNLKNRQDLANERLRISRDLHDEVGSTLSGIVMYSHLAKGQAKAGRKEAAHSIEVVQETASEMVNKLNDVIWLTNPQQDQLDKLIGRLEDYAIKLGSTKHLSFNISVPEEIQHLVLPIEIRKNIYYICKEAIHNAIKYSEGTALTLGVAQSDHTLEFTVKDNGKGFDPNTIKRGNGLNNMQKRAEEINAEYSCQTTEGKGTTITLKCKIKP